MITISSEKNEYQPGEEIRGVVKWNGFESDRLEIRLIWFTEGKGTSDSHIFATRSVEKASPNGEAGFSFAAPHRPYSFSGKLISLTWTIEVLFYPGKNTERHDLVVAPTGAEVLLHGVGSAGNKLAK
jgi:hypothetical protein